MKSEAETQIQLRRNLASFTCVSSLYTKITEWQISAYIRNLLYSTLTTGLDPILTFLAMSIISRATRAMHLAWSSQWSGSPETAMYLSPTVSTWKHRHANESFRWTKLRADPKKGPALHRVCGQVKSVIKWPLQRADWPTLYTFRFRLESVRASKTV